MSTSIWPVLPGLQWELKTSDEFSTLIQKAATPGNETRIPLADDPLIHFELSYDWLRQPGSQADQPASLGAQADELNTLRGFFRAMKGDAISFLLKASDVTENAADSTVTGQALAPDANFVAPLIVTRAGYNETIWEAFGVNGNPGTAPTIKKDGTPLTVTTDYTIQGPGYAVAGITYSGLAVQLVADPTGHTITADFSWYYRVRFEKGTREFDKFLAMLYSAQSVQLVQSRT